MAGVGRVIAIIRALDIMNVKQGRGEMGEQPATWQEVYGALRKCGMNKAAAYRRADDYINQRLRYGAQKEAEGSATRPDSEPTKPGNLG
jgi:hypothetical protein